MFVEDDLFTWSWRQLYLDWCLAVPFLSATQEKTCLRIRGHFPLIDVGLDQYGLVFWKSLLNISGDGEVFTWGRGTHGQLGHGSIENIPHPKFVKFFENYTVTCVSTGWNHSGFATGLQILKPFIYVLLPFWSSRFMPAVSYFILLLSYCLILFGKWIVTDELCCDVSSCYFQILDNFSCAEMAHLDSLALVITSHGTCHLKCHPLPQNMLRSLHLGCAILLSYWKVGKIMTDL